MKSCIWNLQTVQKIQSTQKACNVYCHVGKSVLEMFLGQKLAEHERTGQLFRSKQGLSCPIFFLSIPVLNGLSDHSKPVQGFNHAVFHQVFSCFQPVLTVKPVQKIVRRLNYFMFDRDLTIFCQNPFNAVLRLCFLCQGVGFSLSS